MVFGSVIMTKVKRLQSFIYNIILLYVICHSSLLLLFYTLLEVREERRFTRRFTYLESLQTERSPYKCLLLFVVVS